MGRAQALIGIINPDAHTYTARRLYRGEQPQFLVPKLRRIWRDAFDGDTYLMLRRLLAQDWAFLDPDCAGPVAGHNLVAGIGKTHYSGPPDAEVRDIHTAGAPLGLAWAYLVDEVDDHVLVFEATVHGRWAWHSRHLLQAATDSLVSGPAPLVGDAVTAAAVGHAWRPAVVSLDGLHTVWHAEVCTAEYARGVVVARFDRDTLDEVIDVTETFYRDRLPGSGLPRLALTSPIQALIVRWYAGTSHEQVARILPDRCGRYVLGPHIWPWILSQETVPGHDPTSLRGGTPPILAWVSPAGFAAAYPNLADHPLPLVCAALAVLHPGLPVVIAASDPAAGRVWLPAAGHALLLTARAHHSGADAVVLPRPLGGSWTADPPVPVVTAAQVAAGCELIRRHHIRLADALTEPPRPDAEPGGDPP